MAKVAALAAAPRFSLRPSRKLCTIMGAATAVTLAASGGLYFWQNEEMAKREALVQAKHDEVEHADKQVKRLDTAQGDYQVTSNKLRFLESSVSPDSYIPTMLKQVELLAKSTDLKSMRFTHTREAAPAPPTDKEERKKFKPQPYDKEHIEMDLQGKYWNIARFIYRLTEFPKIISVDSVSIAPQLVTTGQEPGLNVKIKMTGFVFLEDGKGHSGTSPSPASVLASTNGQGTRAVRAEQNKLIDSQNPPRDVPVVVAPPSGGTKR
jgi:Tfp pilus assembly protein PilO